MGENCGNRQCESSMESTCESSCDGPCCENSCERSVCGSCECCPSPAELAMEVGMWAMKEALKDRVKKKIEGAMGKKLDAFADLIVEGLAGHMEMHKGMEKKQDWMRRLSEALKME